MTTKRPTSARTSLPRATASLIGLVLAAATSCGSVARPEVHEYRLAWPRPESRPAAHPRAGTLRVGELQVAATLEGESLRVASGPVRYESYTNHRWAAPLDRMVGDVLVSGLARSRSFDSVLMAADAGEEDWVLSGRVLELEQAAESGEWVGVATLELRLRDAHDGETLFDGEFRRAVPLTGQGPEALVEALSAAVDGIVDDLVERCDVDGLVARAAAREGADRVAAPGR